MGRGQSGSTFVDVLLGNVESIESVGEVISGLNRHEAEICSCKKTVGECEYWTNIRRDYKEAMGTELLDDAAWLWRQSDVRHFFPVYFSKNPDKSAERNEYIKKNNALFTAISNISQSEYVLDSNKEYSRALMILKGSDKSKVIHLFRDPTNIAGSTYFRIKSKGLPFKFMKKEYAPSGPRLYFAITLNSLAWSVGMFLGLLVSMKYKGRVLHMPYEDLVGEPDKAFARIGEFLNVDTSDIRQGIEDRRAFPIGHNVGGNDLREIGTFTFVPNVKGRRKLPLIYKIGVKLFAAPGYLLKALFVR